MHANLSLAAFVLSILFVAIPLCTVAIGMTRFFSAARSSARSLSVMREKQAAPRAAQRSNADAARARAQARQHARLTASL